MPIQRASQAQQIANELRTAIEAGRYPAGSRLPSDAELAREFGVSKPTVTKARSMLVALRLVESRPGAASVVRDNSRDGVPAANRIQLARRTGGVYPEGHFARVLRSRRASASLEVAEAMGLAVGAEIIERVRLTCADDGTPLAWSISHFPSDLADRCPALLVAERIREGTVVYIENRTARRAASLASTAWCEKPEPATLEQLQLPPDSCVLAVSTTTYDTDGELLAYEVELHPPGKRLPLEVVSI